MVSGTRIQGDWFWEITIRSDLQEAHRVVTQFVERAQKWGASDSELLGMQHGMHEAVVNAVRHGNDGIDTKRVRIAYRFLNDDVWMEVEDEGVGFRLGEVADPTLDENRVRPGGRGVMMMRHFMTSVDFNERGNRVTMRKLRARRKKVGLQPRPQMDAVRPQFAADDFHLI